MQLNQAYKEALAIIVRQALIVLGTTLGISGFLTPYLGEFTNDIVSGLLVVGAAGYAQVVQKFKRSKLMQALQEGEVSENRIETMVKSTLILTPSITTPMNEVPQTKTEVG